LYPASFMLFVAVGKDDTSKSGPCMKGPVYGGAVQSLFVNHVVSAKVASLAVPSDVVFGNSSLPCFRDLRSICLQTNGPCLQGFANDAPFLVGYENTSFSFCCAPSLLWKCSHALCHASNRRDVRSVWMVFPSHAKFHLVAVSWKVNCPRGIDRVIQFMVSMIFMILVSVCLPWYQGDAKRAVLRFERVDKASRQESLCQATDCKWTLEHIAQLRSAASYCCCVLTGCLISKSARVAF
jgi:hypothetical protein